MGGGTRTFTVIWFGQVISLLGSSMTRFALTIWVWEQVGEATPVLLMGVFASIPSLLLGLIAGALVDRWNRQWVMMVSDLIAGLSTVIILGLFSANRLEIWHLYAAAMVAGGAGTFQFLAYSAAVTMMLPKSQYARASGMISLAQYASKIGAPLLAGVLLGAIGITGILVIDVATFLFAVSALALVRIPQPAGKAADQPNPNIWQDSILGFRYIFQRPSLSGLLVIVFAFVTVESLGYPLIAPMILARTGSSEVILGTVQAMLGLGGVIGGVLLTIWGGPKRKIHSILIGLALTGLFGDALMGTGQGIYTWLAAAFFLEVFIPTIFGSDQAIWQAKVPPEIQGRVFAARNLFGMVGEPVSMVIGGVLVDHVFEPAMMPGGNLAAIFGGLVGTGPGAGMGLLLVICGVFSALAGLAGYLSQAVRHVEDLLPDHDTGSPIVSNSC